MGGAAALAFFDSFLGGLFGLGSTAMQNGSNEYLANLNLQYQKDRNKIEDARYEEETAYNRAFSEDERAYNRAFAEDERAYNRALQQQIFEREDTALERQAESLSKLGINPLSQNMNGLGAGQVLSSPMPTSVGAPSANVPSLSSRGGQALHNDMKYDFSLAPILSMVDTINGLKTGEYQRDLLKSQRDKQLLDNQAKEIDNLIYMDKYGIKIDENGNMKMPSFNHKEQDFSEVDYNDKNATKNRNVREDNIQNLYGSHDLSSTVDRIATDISHHADDSKTYLKNTAKDATENVMKVLSSIADKKIDDFKQYVKNGYNNDKSRFKSRFNKIKNWIKNHTASDDELRLYSGR